MEVTDENKTDLSKKEVYKFLTKLECPFTWNMDDIKESISMQDNPHDDEESAESPLLLERLLRATMTLFVKTKDDEKDFHAILEILNKCNEYDLALCKRVHPEISSKIAHAVLQATKCFVYFKLNMEEELKVLIKNLENIDDMSNKERSTLLACKAICWSKFRKFGSYEAVQLMREAISLNSNCDLWYFVLGKNLRRQRRDLSISGKPDDDEVESFSKAYNISKSHIHGMYVAQMYQESREYNKALRMYENIFESVDSLSDIILLRLALGFLRQNKLEKAKVCLDKAEKGCKRRSMYLHYMGMYHMKKGEIEKAKYYFEEGMKDDNLKAEKQYLQCLVKLQEPCNVTQYLENMLNKWYEKLPKEQVQPLILDVAFSYWNKKDWKKAIEYFSRALELNPQAKCLKSFYSNYVLNVKKKNVFLFLKDFLFFVDRQRQRFQFDESTIERVNAIKKFCKLNNEAHMNAMKNRFTRFKIRK